MAMTDTERYRKWLPKNRELAYARTRDWIRRNPEKYKVAKRRYHLKRKYGLTPFEFDVLWMSQLCSCAICKSKEPGDPKGWQVDHCHKTNTVRGILCTHCNRMLGGALDNADTLIAGASYLQQRE